MDNLTTLHSKIYKMENAVDHIVNLMTQKEFNFGNGNPSPRVAKNGNVSISSSPRISYSSPRSSTETNNKNPQHFPTKITKLFSENPHHNYGTSSSIATATRNDSVRMNTNSFPKWFNGFSGTGDVPSKSEKSVAKCTQSNAERRKSDLGKDFNGFLGTVNHAIPAKNEKLPMGGEFFENEQLSASSLGPQVDSINVINENFNKQVNEFLSDGDVESAYIAMLCSGDDVSMIGLMDVTGPILHKLSSETASEVLRVMSVQPMDRKFLEFAMPWIQQVSSTNLILLFPSSDIVFLLPTN
jgi:hypothetical protein